MSPFGPTAPNSQSLHHAVYTQPPQQPQLPNRLGEWRNFYTYEAFHLASLKPNDQGYEEAKAKLQGWVVRRDDGRFYCDVPHPNGVPCGESKSRKDRVVDHLKGAHLNARAFVCNGDCGQAGW